MGVMFLIWLNQNNQGPVQLSTSQRPAKALKPDGSEADFHFQFTGCVPLVSYDAALSIQLSFTCHIPLQDMAKVSTGLDKLAGHHKWTLLVTLSLS